MITPHDRRPTHPRRIAGLLVALTLLITLWTCAAAPPASATGGLAVSCTATYVVDPAAGFVTVTQSQTLRNQKPSTASTYFYWDEWSFEVPLSARDVSVTSNGATLRTSSQSSPSRGQRLVVTPLPGRLLYGQTRTLVLTYRLTQAGFRTEDAARVGKGFATFPAVVTADPGGLTLKIVAPESMSFTSSAGSFTETTSGGQTTYTATVPTDGDFFGAQIALTARSAEASKKLEIDGRTIDIFGFPGDPQWLDFVNTNLPKALASLATTTGRPAPKNLLEVWEDVNLSTHGYDGAYVSSASEIQLSEELNLDTLAHEVAHLWVNTDTSSERWVSEGLAQDLAARTVRDLGGTPATQVTVSRSDAHARALESWKPSAEAADAEAYAYPASRQVIGELLQGLTPEQYAAVVGALSARDFPYGSASVTTPKQRLGWRGVLDTLENRGPAVVADSEGLTPAGRVMLTWVVDYRDAKSDLTTRSAMRVRYQAADASDGAWATPVGLRGAMTDWDFHEAGEMLDALAPATEKAAAVQRLAAASGVSVGRVQATYERASDADQIAQLDGTLTTAVRTLEALDLSNARGASTLPTGGLARAMLGIDADAAASAGALADGRFDDALASATSARNKAGQVTGLAIGLLVAAAMVLLALGLAVRWAVRRRVVRVGSQDASGATALAPLTTPDAGAPGPTPDDLPTAPEAGASDPDGVMPPPDEPITPDPASRPEAPTG